MIETTILIVLGIFAWGALIKGSELPQGHPDRVVWHVLLGMVLFAAFLVVI